MSVEALAWAIDLKIPPTQKLVLICLANYADENGVCWPGQKKLADKTGLTDRTVRTQLSCMEKAGLFTRRQRRRENMTRTSDEYTLCINRKDFPVGNRKGFPVGGDRGVADTPEDTVIAEKKGQPENASGTNQDNSDLPENDDTSHRKGFPGIEPSEEPSEEKPGKKKSGPIAEAVEIYEAICVPAGLSPIANITEARRKGINARLDDGGFKDWTLACQAAARSPWWRGEREPTDGRKKFRGNIDALIRPSNFSKLLEGFYPAEEPRKPNQEYDPRNDLGVPV